MTLGDRSLEHWVTDQANERIIEVTLAKDIVWQYGTTGVAGRR